MSRHWAKHSNLIPILMFLVIGSGIGFIWHRLRTVEMEMLDLRTSTTAEQVTFRFENFLNTRLHLLEFMTHMWAREHINTPLRFREVSLAMEKSFRSYQAIAWVDTNCVISWVVPDDIDPSAKHRDLKDRAGMADMLRDAKEKRLPKASPPVSLFQGGQGFETYFPIERGGKWEGFICGVFRIEPLVADCLHRGVLGDFDILITDEGVPLFSDGPPETLTHSPRARSYMLQVLDRRWTLTLKPTPQLIASYQNPSDELFLTVSLLLTCGLTLTLKAYMRRQHAIQQSEQRLRTAVENMPAMMAAFNSRGQILAWNRHCEQLTGYPAAEIVGNPQAEQLLRPIRLDPHVQDSRPFGQAQGLSQEWLIACKDNGTRTISWSEASSKQPVPGWAAWGVGTDITARRQAEDKLLLTQFAIDRAAVATFWIGENAGFFYVNMLACRALGYTQEELLQLTVFDIDPNVTPESWPQRWEAIKARTEPVTFESVHRRKDGTTFPVEITANSMRYKGQYYDFLFAKDITERKQAEIERLNMERKLQQTQRLESLGLLAGGVAHDFNNLLTAMMGNVSLARTSASPGTRLAENLDLIEAAGQQAADLARQLLAFSGGGKFTLTDIDLRSIVEETGALLKTSIPYLIDVKYQLSTLPVILHADAAQIRQIVMNLIINAAEAIGNKPGTITIRVTRLQIDQAILATAENECELSEGPYALLEVADTGCGIPEAKRATIFEPFFSTKSTGRGLGLAAVLGIVRGHKGIIRVESEPDKGTLFQVLLPSCHSEAAHPSSMGPSRCASPKRQEAINPTSETLPGETNGGVILVVDDEQPVRKVARMILEDGGFDVLLAHNGKEGVELFRQHSERIQAVLLDMTMPQMDGRAVLSAIRNIRPSVRVLLSSGYNEQQNCGDLTCDHETQFIQKPYRADQLLNAFDSLLSRSNDHSR